MACPDSGIEQLAAVIALQRKAGRDTFLVVATTETAAELEAVASAVAADEVVVICLTAPPELVARRISEREPDAWPGKTALVEHARELAVQIPSIPGIEAIMSTLDRDPVDVATEVKKLLLARGMLGRDPPPG